MDYGVYRRGREGGIGSGCTSGGGRRERESRLGLVCGGKGRERDSVGERKGGKGERDSCVMGEGRKG